MSRQNKRYKLRLVFFIRVSLLHAIVSFLYFLSFYILNLYYIRVSIANYSLKFSIRNQPSHADCASVVFQLQNVKYFFLV